MSLAERHDDRDNGEIAVGGRILVADGSGVLWCERTATLVVSDLHLEKGSAFARRGVLLPPYDTVETLRLLGQTIARFRPRRVISLGDSFHDRDALERMGASPREALADLQRGRDWLWISGNHDESLAGILPGDHAAALDEDGVRFVHIPGNTTALAEIAGHLHPCVRIRSRIGSQRRRAFVFDSRRLVMPAFGAFAGGLNARDGAFGPLFADGFSVLAISRGRAYAIPPVQCWPD
jgi:DNA ligase-associated metallophosphoesterase